MKSIKKKYEVKDNQTKEMLYTSCYFACALKYLTDNNLWKTAHITFYGIRV